MVVEKEARMFCLRVPAKLSDCLDPYKPDDYTLSTFVLHSFCPKPLGMEGQKLTKKQRKGLAFRQGRRNKPSEAELQDVPEEEALDGEVAPVEVPKAQQPKAVKPETGKKRKRAEDDGAENTKKKRKAEDRVAVDEAAPADGTEPAAGKKAKEQSKKRYILFVGNLPKTVTEEQIASHFGSLPSHPSIRLRRPMEPKPGQPPPNGRAKIFAFLEFTDSTSLQGALKLHRSNLGGKLINVELTVGGGGKGEGRREKLDQKRKQAAEKMKTYAKEGAGEAKQERKQWRQEHKESRPKQDKPRRPAASGVNAIPVG
ncbi:hypothetical protein CALVIDRAFT_537543 [Calocera viscosa TUFC12733]|uniref:RRM domain-containing protein n=1 Tax=Calocera viscosa (strain TUFC12733) TaxID=1330018 RepID=A0A167LRK8_CALVF|nr:hypothetical protein CALVIDRAFT_537543 [Calocera viscosa TUFC12733]